ncbi:MAG: ABC transporter ATP-binding protein [Alphaproteobacteria bacterium]|nr:ABC transporter ATP-binding protein [Alphaproteobacteria bacterium SS10]
MTDRPASPGPQIELATKPPGLLFERLVLQFDNEPLVQIDGDSFPAGEITCLLGTSGVGKSTLLRAIAGLVQPEAGTIKATDNAALSGRVGFMTQQDGLLPWLSVWRNVALGDRLRGMAPNRDRAIELLDSLGLADVVDHLPYTLSGGMRQRVALARVLYEDRPIILMDEPFSALDAVTRDRLQSMTVERLAGRTVVLVTHDPLEALRVGHSIRVLGGKPATLSDPITPDTAPPRSLTDATLTSRHGSLMAQLQGAAV